MNEGELFEGIGLAHSWLRQMVGQLYGEMPWWLDPGDDPMFMIRGIELSFRTRLNEAGYEVPEFVSAEIDPIAHMIAWRDFLAKFVTVH